MNKFIAAQIFGLLGALSLLLSNWQKSKNKVLSFLILDGICYFIQYMFLGALSGAFTNVVGLIRTLIFKYKDRYKILNNKLTIYIIILIYIMIAIFTYDGLISILPVVAAIIYSVSLWQNNLTIIRIGTLIMVIACLIYNIIVKAYMGAIVEGILMISSILSIIKYDVLKEKSNNIIIKN